MCTIQSLKGGIHKTIIAVNGQMSIYVEKILNLFKRDDVDHIQVVTITCGGILNLSTCHM